MKMIYVVKTEATYAKGVWKPDETFYVTSPNAIAAALKVWRAQDRKWNNVRVCSVDTVGQLV
jgi:hypothetical protein